jgi:glycosyltransferase involved in cell wall biosynthesis
MIHKNDKLRIAVDARPLQHAHSGIGRYTKRLCAEFISRGHTVLECRASGSSLQQQLLSQLTFTQEALEQKADIFWSPRHHLPLRSRLLPTVVTIHDMVWNKAPSTMPYLRRMTDKHLMLGAISRANRIIAVSHSTLKDICEITPQAAAKATVVHEAATISPGDFQHVTQPQVPKPYILFVGTLEPRKNLQRIITAFREAKATVANLNLVIAGQLGWGQISIPESADIVWQQPQHDHELAALYSYAHFVIAPSIYEGFGLQVAEAMAFGKAVITSKVSSLPEIAGDAAIYVNPTNVDEIKDAIIRLERNSGLRERLEQTARENTKRFSWSAACEQTIHVFRSAIEDWSKPARL